MGCVQEAVSNQSGVAQRFLSIGEPGTGRALLRVSCLPSPPWEEGQDTRLERQMEATWEGLHCPAIAESMET